jgi:hypothetical protein
VTELFLEEMKPKRKRKKLDRTPYRELLKTVTGYGLCIFCKYAEWEGGFCDSSLTCRHPLSVINDGGYGSFDHPSEVWSGDSDCWGFRPSKGETVQKVGVYIGILLEGKIPHTSDTFKELVAIAPSENDLKNRYW